MTIDQLIIKVRKHLYGIDKDDSCNSHEGGGWWETSDGAQFGRIKLRELEQMLRANWPDPPPAPDHVAAASNMVAPPALPSDIEQAIIDAECALADIAEGDNPLEWAEQRAATALAQIRQVMRRLSVEMSKWMPAPAAMPQQRQAPPFEGEVDALIKILDRIARVLDFMPEGPPNGPVVRRAIELLRQLAPPADGEVAELTEWLNSTGELAGSADIEELKRYWRAAELLQQRHPAPVPVSERLPEPGRKVLAHYVNDLMKCRTICAVWVPAKTWDAYTYTDDDSFGEYDEETDKYFWPEGWYETIENWDDYQYARVHEGEVTHWQPLPQWPPVPPTVKESLTTGPDLPLPAGEGK